MRKCGSCKFRVWEMLRFSLLNPSTSFSLPFLNHGSIVISFFQYLQKSQEHKRRAGNRQLRTFDALRPPHRICWWSLWSRFFMWFYFYHLCGSRMNGACRWCHRSMSTTTTGMTKLRSFQDGVRAEVLWAFTKKIYNWIEILQTNKSESFYIGKMNWKVVLWWSASEKGLIEAQLWLYVHYCAGDW